MYKLLMNRGVKIMSESLDKDKLIAQLMAQNERQSVQLEKLTLQIEKQSGQLEHLRKLLFGSKSEKFSSEPGNPNQLNLFGDQSDFFVDTDQEEGAKQKISYERRIRPKGKKDIDLNNLPLKQEHYTIDEPTCDHCQHLMNEIGTKVVWDEVHHVPAVLAHVEHIAHSYECRNCKKSGKNRIITADAPVAPIQKSVAGPSILAEIAHLKYELFVPLERQLKDWNRLGLKLNSRTLANWMIHPSENLLGSVYDELKKELLSNDTIHCDETPAKILRRSDGKSGKSKSQNWIYRNLRGSEREVVLYNSTLGRSRQDLKDFIGDFQGTIICDGFSAYDKIPGVEFANCWVHVRRYWILACEGKNVSPHAKKGLAYCNTLFHLEKVWRELSPEQRLNERIKFSKPILEEFLQWMDSFFASHGSKLESAINYTLNHRDGIKKFLLDGKLPIHNNDAENAVRPSTLGRKNWLFSTSEQGAKANATYLSLVETAKANNINFRDYLEFLLKTLPNLDYLRHPERLADIAQFDARLKKASRAAEKYRPK
jgi:transposase